MAEEETEEIKQEEKSGSNVVMILVVVLLIFLLLVVAGISFMLMSSDEEKSEKTTNAPASKTVDEFDGSASPREKTKINRSRDYTKLGTLYPLDRLIVNLQTDGGKKRYLRVEASLEFDNMSMIEEAAKKLPIIKDTIISVLTSKTIEDVTTTRGKDRLKDEILSELSVIFVDGVVTNIFFTDFVIQ